MRNGEREKNKGNERGWRIVARGRSFALLLLSGSLLAARASASALLSHALLRLSQSCARERKRSERESTAVSERAREKKKKNPSAAVVAPLFSSSSRTRLLLLLLASRSAAAAAGHPSRRERADVAQAPLRLAEEHAFMGGKTPLEREERGSKKCGVVATSSPSSSSSPFPSSSSSTSTSPNASFSFSFSFLFFPLSKKPVLPRERRENSAKRLHFRLLK